MVQVVTENHIHLQCWNLKAFPVPGFNDINNHRTMPMTEPVCAISMIFVSLAQRLPAADWQTQDLQVKTGLEIKNNFLDFVFLNCS